MKETTMDQNENIIFPCNFPFIFENNLNNIDPEVTSFCKAQKFNMATFIL